MDPKRSIQTESERKQSTTFFLLSSCLRLYDTWKLKACSYADIGLNRKKPIRLKEFNGKENSPLHLKTAVVPLKNRIQKSKHQLERVRVHPLSYATSPQS
jgi:hypothetical protein